eukprot:8224914-Alexandrium_andersonii.AAC.1
MCPKARGQFNPQLQASQRPDTKCSIAQEHVDAHHFTVVNTGMYVGVASSCARRALQQAVPCAHLCVYFARAVGCCSVVAPVILPGPGSCSAMQRRPVYVPPPVRPKA